MNNSPTFPINANESLDGCIYLGMNLRDYFAAQALLVIPDQTAYNMKSKEAFETYVSRRAYEIADAMLKKREQ